MTDDRLLNAAARAAQRPEFAGTAFHRTALAHGITPPHIYAGIARLLGTTPRTAALIALCRAPTDRTPEAVVEWVRVVAPAFGVDPERLAGVLIAGMDEPHQ